MWLPHQSVARPVAFVHVALALYVLALVLPAIDEAPGYAAAYLAFRDSYDRLGEPLLFRTPDTNSQLSVNWSLLAMWMSSAANVLFVYNYITSIYLWMRLPSLPATHRIAQLFAVVGVAAAIGAIAPFSVNLMFIGATALRWGAGVWVSAHVVMFLAITFAKRTDHANDPNANNHDARRGWSIACPAITTAVIFATFALVLHDKLPSMRARPPQGDEALARKEAERALAFYIRRMVERPIKEIEGEHIGFGRLRGETFIGLRGDGDSAPQEATFSSSSVGIRLTVLHPDSLTKRILPPLGRNITNDPKETSLAQVESLRFVPEDDSGMNWQVFVTHRGLPSDVQVEPDIVDTGTPIELSPVVQGPVENAENGHSYYLLREGMSWDQAQAVAHGLGGDLVTVNDAREQAWLVNTFAEGRNLWIGLHAPDGSAELNFVWVNGESATYRNWHADEPDLQYSQERFTLLCGADRPGGGTGTWDNVGFAMNLEGFPVHGVAEIPDEANARPISHRTNRTTALRTLVDVVLGDEGEIPDAADFSTRLEYVALGYPSGRVEVRGLTDDNRTVLTWTTPARGRLANDPTRIELCDRLGLHPNGELLLLGGSADYGFGTDLVLCQVKDGNVLKTLATGGRAVQTIRFCVERSFVAACLSEPEPRMAFWKLDTGELFRVTAYSPEVRPRFVNPSVTRGSRLFDLDPRDGRAAVGGALSDLVPRMQPARQHGNLEVWTVPAGEWLASIYAPQPADSQTMSAIPKFLPDGRLAAAYDNRTLVLYSRQMTGHRTLLPEPTVEIRALASSGDARRLMIGGRLLTNEVADATQHRAASSAFQMIDVETGSILASYTGATEEVVVKVALDETGSRLAAIALGSTAATTDSEAAPADRRPSTFHLLVWELE